MLDFNNAVEDILGGLSEPVIIQIAPTNPRFEEFKQWAIGYVQEHDSLEPHHQTLQQIPNLASADDLEQLLRHNHDYCDDCLLKMYRKYAIQQDDDGCGCGGEDGQARGGIPAEPTEVEQQDEDPFASAQSACADMVKQEEEPPIGGG